MNRKKYLHQKKFCDKLNMSGPAIMRKTEDVFTHFSLPKSGVKKN